MDAISLETRKQLMVAMRAAGITLHKIGKVFELSRERVRQIVGINRFQGFASGGDALHKKGRAGKRDCQGF